MGQAEASHSKKKAQYEQQLRVLDASLVLSMLSAMLITSIVIGHF